MTNPIDSGTPVTELRTLQKVEGALLDADEIFSLLVDAVEDYAIFALSPEGKILTWNAGGHRLKGYAAEEVIGQNFSIFYTPEDLARNHPQNELKIAKEIGKYGEEGWRVKKDGTKFWASIVITALRDRHGTFRGFGKVTRDLTEKKMAEIALRESEERFRLMIEGVQDYAIFMLDPNGNVATWNRGAERTKGYTAEEIVGRHFSTFYPTEDIQSGKPAFELKQAVTNGRFEDEGWRIRKNGTSFWANVIITAIYNSKKELIGFSNVTRDLSERKKAEDALKASYADLEDRVRLRTLELAQAKARAEKAVAARDQFFSMASHELKTPLSSLKLQAQLRKRSVTKGDFSDFAPEKLLELCQDDDRQINRLAYLVDNMLDISKLTSGAFKLKLEGVNLLSVLDSVMTVLEPTLQEAGNTCVINCPKTIHGQWDRTRLEQIFTNLLSNCAKYARHKSVEVTALEDGQRAIIQVRDHGKGIPKDQQQKIFNPFERLNVNEATGLGLGLYIIKQIAEAHGGSVSVVSELNDGATFTVCLPLTPSAEGP